VVLKDVMIVSCPYTGEPRAVQAGKGALEYGISREEQDLWAYNSHQKYVQAEKEGKFNDELMKIVLPGAKGKELIIDKDQAPRPDITLESLAALKTVYNSPTVTPGNAPGMSTGAAMIALMAKEEAVKRGIKPLATIISHTQASGHPHGITSIPGFTAQKVLKKANISIDDINIFEINEAFAVMPLVSTKILGEDNPQKIEAIRAKTNVNGGAIAIGHPTGATAARIVMTLCYELRRRGGGLGLATICGGIGEGESMILWVEK
jgi:acetyl-CoA C-acetyltransferase